MIIIGHTCVSGFERVPIAKNETELDSMAVERFTEPSDIVQAIRDLKETVNVIDRLPSISKHNLAARGAALTLFPPQDLDHPVQRQWAYIRYGKFLSTVRAMARALRQEEALAAQQSRIKKDKYRTSRMTGQEAVWEEIKNSPPGRPVLVPEPMPVDVGPHDDFKPFFCHLKERKPLPDDILMFRRCAVTSDAIDVCKQVPGPDHIDELVTCLGDHPHIKHFLMGNSIVGLSGAIAIANHIRKQPSIQTWYLAGNRIDATGMMFIADALCTDRVCEALWLKRNPLHPEGLRHVARMLAENKTLEILDLDNTATFDAGAAALFAGLSHNTSLRLLYLDANNLGVASAQTMADYFTALVAQKRVGITSLWVGMNPLYDEGVIALARALKDYHALERLCLNAVRMTADGLQVLCEALVDHPKLLMLDVGCYKSAADLHEVTNNLGFKGAFLLAEFIRKNKSVRILDLRTCHLPAEGLAMIADAAETNTTLCYIYAEQMGLRTMQSRLALHRIASICNRNCQAAGFQDLQDYCSHYLRQEKHTAKVVHIDSIYRNNM